MKNFSLNNEIARYVVRKRRIKEKNLTLDDLKDLDISKSTASNIENGKVVRADYFEIYLSKLDLSKKELERLIELETEETKKISLLLDAIEELIEAGKIETIYDQLKRIQIDDFHPLAPRYYFLYGKMYLSKEDYKSAEKKFQHAIHVCNKFSLNPEENIIASCYNHLSICSYYQNDLEQAIHYINIGLDTYDESKELDQVKYKLYANKIFYLIQASRSDEAFLILNEIWPLREKIDKTNDALLNLYTYKAILLRNRGMYKEAIQVCEEGFKILKNTRSMRHYLDLLNVLGSIHVCQKEFEKAFDLLHLALSSDPDCSYPRRQIETYTWLGILHIYKHEWSQAKEYILKVIDISDKKGHIRGFTKALIVMGNLYTFQEQYAEAVPYYQKAIELCEKHGMLQRQYIALSKKAYCFVRMGKTDDTDFIDCLKRKLTLEIELKMNDIFYEIF